MFFVNVVNVVEKDVCRTQFAVVQFSTGGTFLLHMDVQLPMPPWSISGASSLQTTPIIASTLLKVFYHQQLLVNHPNVTIMHTVLVISIPLLKSCISSTQFFGGLGLVQVCKDLFFRMILLVLREHLFLSDIPPSAS